MRALTWENICIVSLARGEDSSILQFYWLKWAATGKQTPALLRGNNLNFSGHLFKQIHERLSLTVRLLNYLKTSNHLLHNIIL